MKVVDAEIARPNWKACKTCKHCGNTVVCLVDEAITLSAYEDVIVCDDYEFDYELRKELTVREEVV